MPERMNPSLSDILNNFRAAREKSLNKTANANVDNGEIDPGLPGSGTIDPAMMTQEAPLQEGCESGMRDEGETGVGDLAAAAQQLDEAGEVANEAQEQVVDAAEALKAVADEFIEERAGTIAKEAQLFGQLFAASCMEQMNKTAQMQEREVQAYKLAADALAGNIPLENSMALNNELSLEKAAAIYDEAWRVVMAKLAGFDDPEEMEEAAGQELSPEEIAAIVAAVQEEEEEEEGCDCGPDETCPACDADGNGVKDEDEAGALASLIAAEQEAGDGDLTDEEVQALAAQLAEAEEGNGEVDPEAVAAAANLLADARDGEIGDELDKAASAAYDTATGAIFGESLQKTASNAYGVVSDTIWSGRMQKTAEEAYIRTVQAMGL